MMTPRTATALLAVLAWAALGLQLALSMRLSMAAGDGALHGAWMFVGYFTVLSNLLVALLATAGARRADGGLDLRWRGCAVTAIVLVGLGYHLLLRNVWNPQGAQWLADVLLHYAVPLAALCWWLAMPPRARIPASALLQWLAWPVAYFAYAIVRGQLTGFYPYYFIDVVTLGVPRVLAHAGGLLLAYLATAFLLRALAHWRRR